MRLAVQLAALALATPLAAQTTLRTFAPPQPAFGFERFGLALAAIGDANNDGVGDFAIGSGQDIFWDPGRVTVVSGLDGSSIRQVFGLHFGQEFGQRIKSVGDADGDGVGDFLAHGSARNAQVADGISEVRLVSGGSGATLRSLQNSTTGNYQNATRRFLGGGEDLDGDAVPDFGVTGYWSNVDRTTRLYSGATLAPSQELGLAPQPSSDGPFAMLGDLDGDGRSEVAYTSRSSGAWLVHITSGATGDILRTCTPAPALAVPGVFELDLVALGDVNGDGVGDLALGGAQAGRVHVFSGANAAQLRTHASNEAGAKFGFALAGGADCDADGVGDLIVGAPLSGAGDSQRGAVSVFSGRTGALLFASSGEQDGERFGWSVSAAGDTDGDGFDELLVGAPTWDLSFSPINGQQIGRALLISPCPLPAREVGAAKLNSLGCLPALSWSGNASQSNASAFTIVAANVLNQKTGTFYYGLGAPVNVPFQGGTLSAPAPRRRTPYQSSGGSSSGSDCSGAFSFDFNAHIASGVDPTLVSTTRVVGQFWSRDPADPFNTNLTSGVEFVICP